MTTTMNLHLQTVPARQGLAWIRHGVTVFKRRPLAMGSLCSFAFMLMLVLPRLIPFLGMFVALLPPLISLGFMLATHEVLQGQAPKVGVFIAPLRITPERRKSQLLMCLLYALLQLGIGVLVASTFGDSVEQFFKVQSAPDANEAAVMAAVSDPRLINGLFVFALLESLLSVPFWHAPALVHWSGQGVPQALFSSTVALWRNRGAFALYGLGWAAAMFTISLVMAPVAALLGPSLGITFMVLAMMALATGFNCSLYFSFVDCFLTGSPDKLELK